MKIFKKDPFGYNIFIKGLLIKILGILSYRRFTVINNLTIKGSEIIKTLPDNNVLFIANHHTYFLDVTAMIHVFNASLNNRKNSLKNIGYLKKLKSNVYFIAEKETMTKGLFTKILAYTGAILISRTWKSKGRSIKRPINTNDIGKINKALDSGWLITFPQGTTKNWAPIRKGTAYIIKENKPLIIPIVIKGFRNAFDKTGLKLIKKGSEISLTIKDPLQVDYKNESIEQITEKISIAIEQHESFK
ncbi:MAG: lysophospholipid acyltransferase family protein [Bacteroidota bacterium]|nr:lysophospholipid acyltransferase family protein [Bacteroidota bacterium]